jgi:hypothetical protein
MSIWTELLLFHGHVATPAALALFAPAGARTAAGPAAGRPSDPPAPDTAHPAERPAAGEPPHHALRAVGQLR